MPRSWTSTLPKGLCGLWKGETLPTLVVASKEIGLEVNAHKTKHMVMSGDQNAGRSHNIKIDNSSFERVEHFRYLGTNLTNENSIQAGNKCRLKSQNACYRLVPSLLSSSLLTKNIKIKVYRTTVFPLSCKGVKLGQNKKTTRLPLLKHSRNCYTCNQTLKRKRSDNFNDIRECILWNN